MTKDDPLFRTAARAYGSRTIGVVLTGRLDDGTAGLKAIKDCGGVALVRDPDEAEHTGMPQIALRALAVDRCLPLKALADELRRRVEAFAPDSRPAPDALKRLTHELAVFEDEGDAMENLDAIARPSSFACPDCAGVLWEINDTEPPRYRCHTGHAFSLRSLEHTQAATTEDALWDAVCALQQQRELMLQRLAEHERKTGADADADRYETRAEEAGRHARLLNRLPADR